jgi:hypothetical protein
MVMPLGLGLIRRSSKSRDINCDSFAAYETISSSALVVEVVTVVYLLARYIISPPNSFIIYVYELLRSGLSINNASLEISKLSCLLKRRAIYRVVFRYRSTRLAAW